MIRKFALTGLVAAAIATTPMAATPTRAADAHDILGGAIALGIIGAIIANEAQRNEASRHVPNYPTHPTYPNYGNNTYHRHGNLTHSHPHHGNHTHGYRDNRHVQTQKPRECLRQRWTSGGWEKYYSSACLRKHGWR